MTHLMRSKAATDPRGPLPVRSPTSAALLSLALALTAFPVAAQETRPADAGPRQAADAPASSGLAATATEAAPFDPAAATRAYLDRMAV